jgi:RNA-directed DNA polymerase
MRENRTCSLCGGRWPARKRATSDPTPAKCPNKGEQAPAEGMEGRRPTKENIEQATPPRTQSRANELSVLRGVREVARRDKRTRFSALLHHVTTALLRESYYSLKRKAAPGVDGVTWHEYETGLDEKLADLHRRIHRGRYRGQPSKRAYIPKADGRQRLLGIAALGIQPYSDALADETRG